MDKCAASVVSWTFHLLQSVAMESDVEGIGYKEYTFSIKDLENFGDLVRKIEGECEFCKVFSLSYLQKPDQ